MAADVKKRPTKLHGATKKVVCGCGNMYVTINEYEGAPFEVFVSFGKSGSCMNVTMGGIAISISHGLRGGIPLNEYMKAYAGARCSKIINKIEGKGQSTLSCIDGLARAFRDYLEERGEIEPAPIPDTTVSQGVVEEGKAEMRGNLCSECGGPVVFAEGCDHCLVCGYSENCQ